MTSRRVVSSAAEDVAGVINGQRLPSYVGTLLPFCLLTRSSIPIGDAKLVLNMALSGDPALLH